LGGFEFSRIYAVRRELEHTTAEDSLTAMLEGREGYTVDGVGVKRWWFPL